MQGIHPETFDHIKIGVRERPLSEDERANVQVMIRADNDRLVAFYPQSKEGLVYNYDYHYPEDATQVDLFQTMGLEMCDVVMSGYSSTCVAYGPSASGKTHTLFGSDQEPGLIQLTTKELFHRMERNAGTYVYGAKVAYWEMNADSIRDALDIDNVKPHQVRKNKERGMYISDMTEVEVASWAELDECIMNGNINRIKLSEQRNARWHGFIKIYIEYYEREAPETKTHCSMTFAHLKGSDRVGMKGAVGDVMKHGSSINKSMSLLGSAILHAVEFRRRSLANVPEEEFEAVQAGLAEKSLSLFSGCKLTQALGHALSGAEATIMLASVSTLDYHETTDTLENLQNAQQITCSLQRRTILSNVGKLRAQLQAAEAKLPQTTLADGHPLTEIEEKVQKLRLKLGGSDPDTIMDTPKDKPPAIPGVSVDPKAQKWKHSVVKAKMHGDRSTVYIPTKGDKHTYKGQWAKGRKEGHGEHITDKTKYVGYWKEGMQDGDGTWWTREAPGKEFVRQYSGGWRRGLRHGRGVNWYANGDIYDGYFEEGKRSAIGKLFLANGDRIEGQFHNDMVEGWATLYKANGDWFEGHWANGMREGPGVWYYEAREQCYRGEWHENIPKHGCIEDLPKKTTNAASSFLPRIGLVDHTKVLAKEKSLLDEKRRREWEAKGLTWEVPERYHPEEEEEEVEAQEATGKEQVSW